MMQTRNLTSGRVLRPPRRAIAILAVATLLAVSTPTEAQSSTATERKVKVAYIYNFIRYVQWPKSAFSADDSPFVIGILEDDPHGRLLDHIATSKKAMGRKIVIRRFDSVDEIDSCHLVFVTGNINAGDEKAVIDKSETYKALLIMDTGNAAHEGAPIRFFLDQDGTIGLQINITAMQSRDLKADAKLLKIASVIQG